MVKCEYIRRRKKASLCSNDDFIMKSLEGKIEFEKIKAIIADKMDLDPDTITEQSSFKDLEMDSLDMVEIVMDMEDEFDITIETSEGLETIADLIELIRSQK